MYLCYVADCELKDVVRMAKEPWNPDTHNITVTTDSTVGSNDHLVTQFYDNDGNYAGGVLIFFLTRIKYQIGKCTYATYFTVSPAPQKTWTITYNTTELRLVVQCNGVQELNLLLSNNSVCARSGWRPFWERKPTQMQFFSTDNASDSFCSNGKYNGDFWGVKQ